MTTIPIPERALPTLRALYAAKQQAEREYALMASGVVDAVLPPNASLDAINLDEATIAFHLPDIAPTEAS